MAAIDKELVSGQSKKLDDQASSKKDTEWV
jgi:hypothetical protein